MDEEVPVKNQQAACVAAETHRCNYVLFYSHRARALNSNESGRPIGLPLDFLSIP